MLILALALALGWPPPANGGDGNLAGLHDNLPPYDDPGQTQIADALSIIESTNSALATEISAVLSADGVSTVALPLGSADMGYSDADTMALQIGLDAENLAAVIVHEWNHIRTHNGVETYDGANAALLPEPCQEVLAYNASLQFMCLRASWCDLMDLPPPYRCVEIEADANTALWAWFACNDILGGSQAPLPHSGCGTHCSN